MPCNKCNSKRMLEVYAQCNDMCDYTIGETSKYGYVPDDLGIGGGDNMEFSVCLDCGTMAGDWPLAISKMEKDHVEMKMKNQQIHQMALVLAKADNEYRGYNHAGLADIEQPMSWYSNHVESWAWYCHLAECALQHMEL